MAKQIVLNVLQSVLSDFLVIDKDNFDLNLAVWSGSIVLHNVKLKTDKLFRNFNLSFVHGVVKTLEVQIPWTALMNSPVRINIDGVYLQVKPMNVSALDKNQTRNRLRIMKQENVRFSDARCSTDRMRYRTRFCRANSDEMIVAILARVER